jgi:hypothetical protein
MTWDEPKKDIEFARLMRLRLAVARFGEMDAARWWNTGGLLGRKGGLLMGRGFPKTHHFVQARTVFTVARARCNEVFSPTGCATLWNLPPNIEDQFDARWHSWLESPEDWGSIFEELQSPPDDLVTCLRGLDLHDEDAEREVKGMRRSAEGKAVPIARFAEVTNESLTLLAAAFSRGEAGKLAVPYIRVEA